MQVAAAALGTCHELPLQLCAVGVLAALAAAGVPNLHFAAMAELHLGAGVLAHLLPLACFAN